MIDTIKDLCRINRISVSELEELLGIGKNTIYRWDKSSPSIDKVIKVADYFEISLDELCERKNKDNGRIMPNFAENSQKPYLKVENPYLKDDDVSENRHLTQAEKEILELLAELNEEGQEVVLNTLRGLTTVPVYKKNVISMKRILKHKKSP